MKILEVITKEVFEAHVPAAKMPERNTSVYDRMKDKISTSYEYVVNEVVSREFERLLDTDEKLAKKTVRFICLSAFAMNARSLDLVLTATGFGVVSTDSTAPASRARVDALIDEIRVDALRAKDDIVQMMIRIEGWSETAAARHSIPRLFYRPEYLERYSSRQLTSENWQNAVDVSYDCEPLFIKAVGSEYAQELLEKTRKGALTNADIIIVEKYLVWVGGGIRTTGDGPFLVRLGMQYDEIVRQLEDYPESYPTYLSSKLYAKRHGKRFENKKEDPSFFFM